MYANYLRERSDQVNPVVVHLICIIGIGFYCSPIVFAILDRLAS